MMKVADELRNIIWRSQATVQLYASHNRCDQISPQSGAGRCRAWSTTPAKSPAFTLIELVLVIAIVATLASLLVVGLNRGKEATRTTVCASNLRQLALGASLYSLDNNDLLPDFRQWLQVASGDVTTGKLYPYTHSEGVYLCPTDKLTLDSSRGMSSLPSNSIRASTYAMNCLLCHQQLTCSFVSPAQTFLLMEPNLAPHDVSGVVGPIPWMGITNNAVSTRHNSLGHLLFCDLHLEKVKRTVSEKLQKSNRFWLAAPTEDSLVLGFLTTLPDP